MMHRRDLKRIDSRVDGLHDAWIGADVLVEMIQVTEERVREDVFLCAAAKQKRFDRAAALHACGTNRCHEDQRLDRRWLVHVDACVQKKLDGGLASAEHGELQKMGGVLRGGAN